MGRLLRAGSVRPARLVGTALAVALAVTLVSGTFTLTDTVDSAFRAATTPSPTGADVVVRATARFTPLASSLPERAPVPESLVGRVAAVPGVQRVWGAIQGFAQLVDEEGRAISPKGLPTVGSGWTPGDSLEEGRAPRGPGEVAIDRATAVRYGFELGDRIRVVFHGGTKEFTVGGLLRAASDLVATTRAIFDPETAQQVLGQDGQVDAIPVRAAAGLSPDVLRARINAVLPERYEAVTGMQAAQEAEQSWTKAVSFLPTALLAFAAVALLVGAFIIFNTFAILVAQRTRELGLLRAVGATRAQLTALVLAEAAAVGTVGSAAGILLGLGAARGLLALFAGMGFELPDAAVVLRARTVVVGMASGVTVTTLAALVPAWRATRVSPTAAIGGAAPVRTGPSRRRGALVAAVRLVGAPLLRTSGHPAFLGRENAVRNPGRTAATAGAMVIGIGLVGVVAVLASSMKASATAAVEDTLRADFVLTAAGRPGSAGGVPAAVADRLQDLPQVDAVAEFRAGQWGLGGIPKTLVAVDPSNVTRMRDVDPATADALRRLDDHGVVVRDTVAEHHGWRMGDELPMTFTRTGTQRMRIAGMFSTRAVSTDYAISLGAHEANYTQRQDVQVDVALSPGTSRLEGRTGIERALADFPGVRVMDRAQVLADQQARVDELLRPATALLVLSVVIALLGIANTLSLSVHERTRELGLLRAVGMARGQLRSMVRSEAVVLAALGSLLGVAVAVVLGWAAVAVMHDEGMAELVYPTGQLAGLAVAAVAAGLVAGALPARRASRLPILDAVASVDY